MSTPRTMRPWVRVDNARMLVNGIQAGCWFYLGNWRDHGRPKHPGFIASMTLRTLMGFMEHGRLYLARKIKQEAHIG